MKLSKLLLLGALFALPIIGLGQPAPGGNVGVAVNPSGNVAFLNVDANGNLLTTSGGGGGLTQVSVNAPLTGLGTVGSPIILPVATSGANGYLSSTDWTTFNNKMAGSTNAYSMMSNITASTAPASSNTQLILGTPGYSETGYNLGQITAASGTQGNTYAQLSIQGLNNGNAASTDFVATADNGSMTTHYVNLGINSSTNSTGTYPTGANLAYVESVTDDLYVGTVGNNTLRHFANSVDVFDLGSTTGAVFAPAARTSGVLPYFKLTIPADTGLTATAEAPGLQMVTGTRTWATSGTVANQREVKISAPTYASASPSQTFTVASTLDVTGPPIQGTNAILSNPLALNIETGPTQLAGGNYTFSTNPAATVGTALTLPAVTTTFQTSEPASAQAVYIGQPTFTAASGTITTANTLYIAGPPIASTLTITTPYALNIAQGNSTIGGSYTYGALPSGAWALGTTMTRPAATFTVTGTNTATTGASSYHGIATFTDASAGTILWCGLALAIA